MNNRAISFLEIKKVDDEARTIEGIASTPTADRLGDIVEPKGAEFKLPIPFLWQHDTAKPVGHVTEAKVTDKGILIKAQIVKVDEPGVVKDRVDEAWQSIKSGLVKGLSIGFKGIDIEPVDKKDPFGFGGRRFLKWLWLELSAVTIAANGDCTITQLKAIDSGILAASGKEEPRTVRLMSPPGVSGNVKPQKPKEALDMKTVSEQIESLEATRAAKAAALGKITERSLESNETMDSNETKEFDSLKGEIDSIDENLKRLRELEKIQAKSAKPVDGKDSKSGSDNRDTSKPYSGSVSVREKKVDPGIRMTRVMKCLYMGGNPFAAAQVADNLFGKSDPVVVEFLKANVAAGSTLSGNWAENLVGEETNIFAAFLEYLRPMTILGKFGTNGIPALNPVPFRVPIISQTAGGSGYWVGEGKAKPLTSFGYDRTVLLPLKVAAIVAVTEELLMDSSPSAETQIRNQLVAALRERLDTDFINPDKAAVSGISPASILNGITPLVTSGSDAEGIRADVGKLIGAFVGANNPLSSGVWIMSNLTAMRLGLMRNPLGQKEFSDITVNGGMFEGFPVIASEYVSAGTNGDFIALVNAQDIFLGDEGGFRVDLSREASLEMSDAPSHNSTTPTGSSSLVSMFQTNSVAFRAERRIDWARARTSAVAWMHATWGSGLT